MKKLFALTLALMLLSAPLAVRAAEHANTMNEFMATAVYVCTEDTDKSSNKETEAAGYANIILKDGQSADTSQGLKSGKMTFKDGVLTIENVTGVSKVEAFNGSLIVNVVGTNEFVHTKGGRSVFVDDQADAAARKNSDVTITSSTGGSLKLTGTSYIVFSRSGNVLIDGNVKLDISCTSDAIEKGAVGNAADGTIAIGGDANVKITANKNGILNGTAGGLIEIRDNAVVDVTVKSEGSFAVGIPWMAADKTGEIVVKDNAKLTANANASPVFSGGTKGTLAVSISTNAELSGASIGLATSKITYVLGKPASGTLSVVCGDSAAAAKSATTIDSAAKYAKVSVTGAAAAATTKAAATAAKTAATAPKTADAGAVVLAVLLVSGAAAVVVKKKH